MPAKIVAAFLLVGLAAPALPASDPQTDVPLELLELAPLVAPVPPALPLPAPSPIASPAPQRTESGTAAAASAARAVDVIDDLQVGPQSLILEHLKARGEIVPGG